MSCSIPSTASAPADSESGVPSRIASHAWRKSAVAGSRWYRPGNPSWSRPILSILLPLLSNRGHQHLENIHRGWDDARPRQKPIHPFFATAAVGHVESTWNVELGWLAIDRALV